MEGREDFGMDTVDEQNYPVFDAIEMELRGNLSVDGWCAVGGKAEGKLRVDKIVRKDSGVVEWDEI